MTLLVVMLPVAELRGAIPAIFGGVIIAGIATMILILGVGALL